MVKTKKEEEVEAHQRGIRRHHCLESWNILLSLLSKKEKKGGEKGNSNPGSKELSESFRFFWCRNDFFSSGHRGVGGVKDCPAKKKNGKLGVEHPERKKG